MRLVDTSAWIEWLLASPTAMAITPLIPPKEEWLVPTIVQHELAKWLARVLSEEKSDQVIAFTRTCIVATLDTRIALFAADHCRYHKLATADAVVYATAQQYGAELLTCDTHFEGLPGVVLVRKITPTPPIP